MLETFRQLGLPKLAERVAAILSRASLRPDEGAIRVILHIADQAISELQRGITDDPSHKLVLSRQRYAILCGLKILADELEISAAARAILNDYLQMDDRSIPEILVSCLPNGCAVDCRMTDYVGLMTWLHGAYEPIEAYIFSHLVGPEMVVIDGGANFGQYTLLAATAVGPRGAVHSFEPYPGNFRSLAANVARNGLGSQCYLNARALWSDDCDLFLFPPPASLTRSYATNDGAYQVIDGVIAQSQPREVTPSVRLDGYVGTMQLQRVDIVKLDVEGSEPRVLDGAMDVLSRWHPLVLIEVNDDALSAQGYDRRVIFNRMAGLGYDCAVITGLLGDVKHCNCIFYTGRVPEILAHPRLTEEARAWALTNIFERV